MTEGGMIEHILIEAKNASRALLNLSKEKVDSVLRDLADSLDVSWQDIVGANAADLACLSADDYRYDRLKLSRQRIEGIASDIRNVASLPSPLGETIEERILPNGLKLTKTRVPFGVIAVIYEARPNVTFDVFSLCLKSGSACILKGGSVAEKSNIAAVSLIRSVLRRHSLPEAVVSLLPNDRSATAELLSARGYVDLVIPRGSRQLIDYVVKNSLVPVIETGAGVCHCYIDASADIQKAVRIVNNAKTRRVSVCNALDCMIVHKALLPSLPQICSPLGQAGVEILADAQSYAALEGKYPDYLLKLAGDDDFGREFLALRMSVKTVQSIDEAISHIGLFGTGHSESIVCEDASAEALFFTMVDAACVYCNAPTSFTDGAQFGMGAEIGISTQKMHARGPMALREITAYKWLIKGDGQIRPV